MKNGAKAKSIVWNEHPSPDEWGGRSAYFKNIGIPLSIGMQFIMDGKVPGPGVYPPEAAFEPDAFFGELEKRGIKIYSKVEYI